jgi:DNA-directed RNA polymerase subunit beta'
MICDWDPFNAVIVSETAGKVEFEHIEEGITSVKNPMNKPVKEKVIIETRDKTKTLLSKFRR